MARVAAENIKDITEAICWARDEGQALEIYSGGTKRKMGRPIQDGHLLCLKALKGVSFYEPDEQVIGVQAATSVWEVNQLLMDNGQTLAFEPPDWSGLFGTRNHNTSCGGVVASNHSGPRRPFQGAARDHLLGFNAISGRGVEFQSGGRVVKNVSGYDLSKLMAGSWGTLAVLHHLIFKTMPLSQTSQTLFLDGLKPHQAFQAMSECLAQNSLINAITYIPKETAPLWVGTHFSESILALRLEGTSQGVKENMNRLKTHFGKQGAPHVSGGQQSQKFWQSVKNLDLFSLPHSHSDQPIWRILTPPSQLATLIKALSHTIEDMIYFIDWGGSLVWLSHNHKKNDFALDEMTQKAIHIRNLCAQNGAQAILIRAQDDLRHHIGFFPPLSSNLAALTSRIKHSFDPKVILNPGRLYFGI